MCPSRRNDRSRPLAPRGSARRESERRESERRNSTSGDERSSKRSSPVKDGRSPLASSYANVKKSARQGEADKKTPKKERSDNKSKQREMPVGASATGRTPRRESRANPPLGKPSRDSVNRGPQSRQRRRSRQGVTLSRKPTKGHSLTFGGLVISWRTITFVVMSVFLIVLLAPPIFQWWRQEQSYHDIQLQLQQAKERNARMSNEVARWNDPEYIASQARSRLGLMKSGETQFSVSDPPGVEPQDDTQTPKNSDSNQRPRLPWVKTFALTMSESDAPQSKRVAGSPDPIMTGLSPQSKTAVKPATHHNPSQSLRQSGREG